jgi:D-alanyl-D-alanine carboxypeptidase
MTTSRGITGLSILAVALAFVAGCEDGGPSFAVPSQPVFDLDVFVANIEAGISPSADGYVYAVTQSGNLVRSGATGWARRPGDENPLPHSLGKRSMIFSVSKVITAVAALQLLDRRGLTPDSLMAPWLPPDWPLGPGVAELTFRELMTHTSGLSSVQTSSVDVQGWDAMRDSLEVGVVLPKTRNYLNLNYALFQVLIPSLWRGLDDGPSASNPLSENFVSFWYRTYVNDFVLQPSGIGIRDCTFDNRETMTLFYAHGLVVTGAESQNRTLWCPSGGWYLSAEDLARFMVYLNHTDLLLTPAQRTLMDDGMLGWDGSIPWAGVHGSYRGKSGGMATTAGGVTRGGRTYIMKYPGTGTEVVLKINSRAPDEPESLGQFLTDAYDNAWVDP